jgi:hypothetical protein
MKNNTVIFKGEMYSKEELTQKLIELSKKHKGFAIAAAVSFNTVHITAYTSSTKIGIDSPTSRTMKSWYNAIAFKNGKPVQPTKGWKNRSDAHSYRVYNS